MTTYLLDNKRYFNQLKNYNIIPVEEEIVIDNNLLTCSGPGNALELSFRVLEKLTSKENVKIIQNNIKERFMDSIDENNPVLVGPSEAEAAIRVKRGEVNKVDIKIDDLEYPICGTDRINKQIQ